MIKQIAAKKIDSILTRHFTKESLDLISNFTPPTDYNSIISMKVLGKKASLLPPMNNKPSLPSETESIIIQNILPDIEEGFLLMGDVVALIALETKDMQSSSGVIFGDGIANNILDCVPVSKFQNSEGVQFRLCLFRIEPVRQYGYSNMRQTYVKFKTQNDRNLEKLINAEEEEQNDNEAESEVLYGKVLTFGEMIQLRHIHSNCFLTTSKEVSKERGCLQVVLDGIGNEGSWFELTSCSPIRQDGENIRYSDNFCLTVDLDDSKYFLHMGMPKSWKEDQDFELNASSSYTYWQVRKFISHSTIKQNPNFVATGDSFRIQFKQTEGFLSISPREINEIIQDHEADKRQGRLKVKKECESKVFIEKEKNCLSVWELVRENPFIGGLAEKDSIYRIKHIATGLLLSVTKSGLISLSYENNSDMSLFRIIQEPNDNEFHTFNSLVKIESVALKKVIFAGVKDFDDKLLFSEADHSYLPVNTTINRKQDTKTGFVLYDELESNTIFIYQISTLIPKTIDFYNFVKVWGCVKRGTEYSQNYEIAKTTEAELEMQVNFFIKILNKVYKRALKDDKNLKIQQETLRLTGFVELLLKFAMLIDKKLEHPIKFPLDRIPKNLHKSNPKIIFEAMKRKIQVEFLQFPGVIGINHLTKLAKEIHRILYYSIKDNVKSCKELQKYQDFLIMQLFSYENEVGMLLKELYKQSSGTIAKSNTSLFKLWVDFIKPISQKDENLDEQIVTLKILASLSISDFKGIPGNQYHLACNFFSKDRDFTILKGFIVNSVPFFGLFCGPLANYQEFLANNPEFKDPDLEQSKDNVLVVNLWSMNSNFKFVTYFSSVLAFFQSICTSRNEKNIHLITDQLGLSYEFLYFSILCKDIHCKLRTSCLKLLWVLFFDKDSRKLLNETQQRCILWNSEGNCIENPSDNQNNQPDLLEIPIKETINLNQTIEWVRNVWTSNENPISGFENESLQNQARFVIELIRFSKELINCSYVNYNFATIITPYILTLINRTEKTVNLHWTTDLRSRLNKLKKERLQNELVEIGIDFFQVKFFGRLDSEVKLKLNEYCGKVEEVPLSFRVNHKLFSPKLGVMNDNRDRNGVKDRNRRSTDENKIQEVSLDTVLLNLLFTNSEATLKDKIIHLLLSNLDMNNKIIQALNDLVLIPKCPIREVYFEIEVHVKECQKGLNAILFLEPEVLLNNLTQENPEIAKISKDLFIRMKSIKSFITKKNPESDRFILQKICKNLLLDKLCLRFFKEEWPWVDGLDNKMKLKENILDLYRIVVKTLVNFCYVNTENQELIFYELKSIESFKMNFIGIKILMAEVIKCRRNNLASIRIIENLFKSMSQKQNPMETPEDIMIIKNLIHDESLKFYYSNQTTIIKHLLATRNLISIFSLENSWNLTKYNLRSIKSFSMMIDVIARCAIHNDYATHQARRMMPCKAMIEELKKTKHLILKKSCLHFIFYVYFMKSDNIDHELPENDFEELLETVILQDISQCKNKIAHLKIISSKDMYDPIPTKKSSEKKIITDVKKKNSEILNKEETQSLDWWNYINSHRPDTPNISSGLICVIKRIAIECKPPNIISKISAKILLEIKLQLKELIEEFFIMIDECLDINMEFMIQEYISVIAEIPEIIEDVNDIKSIQEAESRQENETQVYQKFLDVCKNYILESNIGCEDFIKDYSIYEDNKIPKSEFMFMMKKCLKMKISFIEISIVCHVLESEISSDVALDKFNEDLRAIFINLPIPVLKAPMLGDMVIDSTVDIALKDFKEYIGRIEQEYEQEENDISLMVTRVKEQLIDPALEKSNTIVLVNFIKNLTLAFFRPEHRIYLIQILNQILIHELEKKDDLRKNVSTIQSLYTNEKVVDICFEEFSKEKPIDNTMAALQLLIDLVKNGSISTKQRILNYLKPNSFGIFSYIRVQFREVQDILSSLMNKVLTKRKKTLSAVETVVESKTKKKDLKNIKLAEKIFLFLQCCCNNCYLPFQEFLQIQNPDNPVANIDLVSEMCQFLIRMEGVPELKHTRELSNYLSDLAIQCLRSLGDCCQGPCHINQLLLGTRRRLYEFMNWFFSMENPNFNEPSAWLNMYKEGINFLNALIEANKSLKVAKIFIREINLELLSTHSALIWKQIIEGRERIIYQDNQGMSCGLPLIELSGKPLEDFERDVIETGFNINILILTLQYLHPSECKIKLKAFALKDSDVQNKPDVLKRSSVRPGFRELFTDKFTRFFSHRIQDNNSIDIAKAQDFYYSNISSVEINNREQLAKLFFRVPTMCRYLTVKSRTELITKANRTSHQEKIEDFCNKSKIYEVEMKHQQGIARYPIFDYFLSKWRIYGILSFIMIICINLILLGTVKRLEDTSDEWEFDSSIDSKALLASVAIIQIILASLVYICYLFEYLPVIKYRVRLQSKGSQNLKYMSSYFNRIKGTELMKEVLIRTETKENISSLSCFTTLQIIFTDFECVYNLVYLIISVLCWKWALLYSVLLLDLIKRNKDLKNILRSITLNSYQLILTTILGIIVIYIFSIVGFLSFSSFYSDDYSDVSAVTYCDNLINCFISTMITGVRQGGGIGDALVQPVKSDTNYWSLMVFNLFFFAIVINILLNIIFGIIIDTFGELRDQNQAEQKDIKENCFICGNQRFLFEIRRINWGFHINMEHNPSAYLAFLIYIRHKELDLCSGAEKYVKEKLEKNETLFFPLTSLSLESGKDVDEEKLDEVQEKVERIFALAERLSRAKGK